MNVELSFTDKEITAWGGMGLMKRMLDHIGFDEALKCCGLPEPKSNRGYRPEQLIVQFMLSIWCGANRFEHGEVTRHDPVLKDLFGFKRMANCKAVMRLFCKFSQRENNEVFGALYRWWFEQLSLDGLTLDLDSTVMTRYGDQEGSARGYNPAKPGRVSHHPLMAFISDARMIANCWLRPGDAHTANNVESFLYDTLHRLQNKHVALVRADSGFSADAVLKALENQRIHYIVALRMMQPLQRALVDQFDWWKLDEGIELTHFEYQASSWEQPRRVIGIRQHIAQRPDAKGKTLSLFANDPIHGQYRYAALVTDLKLSDADLWRLYRGRADCENRIKELKYDFAADSFCLKNFWATEACLQTVMLAYNCMSLFRQAALKSLNPKLPSNDVQHTLKTLRYKLFAKAAYITHEGRKDILKLAVAMHQREWISGIWDRTKSFDLPVRFEPLFAPAASS